MLVLHAVFGFHRIFFFGFSVYDSSRLPTDYNAADNIPRARFPTPRTLLERYLQFLFFVFFFFAVFTELTLAKDFRLCKKQ